MKVEDQLSLTLFRGTGGVATIVLNIVIDGLKITPQKIDMIHSTQTTILSIKDISIVCRYTYLSSLLTTESNKEIGEEKEGVENIRFHNW